MIPSTQSGKVFIKKGFPADTAPSVDVLVALQMIPAAYQRWVIAGVWDFVQYGTTIDWLTDINDNLSRGDWRSAIRAWIEMQELRQGYPVPYVSIGNLLWASMQREGAAAHKKEIDVIREWERLATPGRATNNDSSAV